MKRLIYILLVFTILPGCSDDFGPDEAFLKIYDDQLANRKYYPLDIEQTNDGGYIVLSAVDQWDIYVMKINSEGDFEWSYTSSQPYVNAVPKLINVNGSIYFFCMDKVGLFTYVMHVDEGAQTVSQHAVLSNVLYPLAASYTGQAILLQNYNRDMMASGFHKLGADFSIQSSASFNIFEDIEPMIVDHITHAGKRLHFFTGSTSGGGNYFMNGFYNYSFSIVFTDGAMNFTGVHNGSNYNGGASSLLHLTGETFALSRFSFGNNYINPAANLSTSTIGFLENAGGTGYSELKEDAYAVSSKLTIGSTEYIAILSHTISQKIVLYLFNPADGTLAGKKYIGNSVPYEACDFMSTADGGIIVLVQVYVAGSYPRVGVIKYSAQELSELVNAG